jgi:signal peptidase I
VVRKIKMELWQWLKAAVIAVAIVVAVHIYGFTFSDVDGTSMKPTLANNDRLFVNKLVYQMTEPHLGDVVILKYPEEETPSDLRLVKRVVALPGDKVEIHNRQLYVNGKLVDEPYTDHLIDNGNYGPYVVEVDHYFVMGDNRRLDKSVDSRTFDAVPRDLIIGRAEAIVWPITHWGGL